MKTLKAENIELEANIKQVQQDQALLAQQHQQQLQQNSGFPTQAQQPESQAQPQQQAQVVQSGPSGGVQTIRVNQQQPQEAQPHYQMQQPGAGAGPPGGIQIFQQLI